MSIRRKNTRPRSPRIQVKITPEILAQSQVRNSSHCMIAEAIKAAVPNAKLVAVDLQTCRYTDPEKHIRYTYLTPRIAQAALVAFDQGELTENEFAFTLAGAQITRSRIGKAIKRAANGELPLNPERDNIPRRASLRSHAGGDPHVPAERIGGRPPPPSRFAKRREFGLRLLRA